MAVHDRRLLRPVGVQLIDHNDADAVWLEKRTSDAIDLCTTCNACKSSKQYERSAVGSGLINDQRAAFKQDTLKRFAERARDRRARKALKNLKK